MSRVITLLVLCLSSPAVGWAQGPLAHQSLEELLTMKVDTVSSAARREQLVTEAPSSVTIVTAHEIATHGWRTLADVFRATRSFYVTYDRNYTYLGARGFGRPTDYNNRVLLLVNGHRLNDNVYDAMGIGTDFPIDLALVDRIEIIRGPGSALYGTSAFFAVVNVLTRRGGALGGTEGSVESASFGTWRARASYGATSLAGDDLLLSVTHMDSAGVGLLRFPEYDDAATGPGLSRGADGDQSTSVFGSGRIGALSLEGAYQERTKHLPTGAWDTSLSDARSRTVDGRSWLGATWAGDVGRTGVTARGFYDHMRYDGTYASGDEIFADYSRGDWLGGEVTLTRRISRRHRLTTGSEYREHLRQLQNIAPRSGEIEVGRRSRQLGLYAQDEVSLAGPVTAVLGARADYWSLDGWSAHPRLGLIVRPNADTSVKLLYGSAYRAPNAYERFYTDATLLANPRLRPETLRTGEVVVERYLNGQLRVTGAAYVTRIARLISQYEDETFAWHDNGVEVHAAGAEFEAERRWTNGIVAQGAITVQRARERSSPVRLSNSPGTLGTARLELPLWSRDATLAADWQYVSERLSNRGTVARPYHLGHLTWRFVPRGFTGSFAASVYNLFDTAYAHPVGAEFRQDLLWQDGRTFSLRATVGF